MPPEDCNASSRASSVTEAGDTITRSQASSFTAEETSPPASQGSVTVRGDSPSGSLTEEDDQTQVDNSSQLPSLKVSISVCRIESVSIDFIPVV